MVKVFISHSSKDKNIVGLFKDIILKSGIGLKDENIFYTSSPETGVPIGENIPEYIKRNLIDCDYVFLMISENYKKSEVCLNEMGAAMVIGKKVFPILLYNYSFDKVGWLIDHNLCVKIEDEERLDEIRDVFYENGICNKTSVWNLCRNNFIERISCYICEKSTSVELGYVDYQIELENSLSDFNKEYDNIVKYLSDRIKDVNPIIYKINTCLSLENQREMLSETAGLFNDMADFLDKKNQFVRESVLMALDSVLNIFTNFVLGQEEKENWIQSVTYFKSVAKVNRKEIDKVRTQVLAWGNLERTQIEAKKRLVLCLDFLLGTFDESIKRSNDIIYF